jgi:hypothetical protein
VERVSAWEITVADASIYLAVSATKFAYIKHRHGISPKILQKRAAIRYIST